MTTKTADSNTTITDNFELLNLMVADMKNDPSQYQPGPFWENNTIAYTKSIRKFGMSDFRGYVDIRYIDNAYIDVRGSINYGIRKFISKLCHVFPIRKVFDMQVYITKSLYDETVSLRTALLEQSERVRTLVSKYKIPSDNCRGGSTAFVTFNDQKVSHYYLQVLDMLDNVADNINLNSKKCCFEIGGGFGANTHLLVENYPNMRKFIYLDIPPHLYIGTQYLKSFYGSSVKNYKETRGKKEISFAPNDELEIFCITPAQIEHLDCEIDFFHNANSFVEMPKPVIMNYAKQIERLLSKNGASISLVSYDGFSLKTTFHPDELQNFFSVSFKKIIKKSFRPGRSYFYYVATYS